MARLAGAGRETRVGHLLVLDDEVGQHALVSGDLAHGVEVDLAELLDVQRPAILVGLVVVLRVVGEDLGLLLVVEVGDQVVEAAAEGRAPLLRVNEPVSSLVSVRFFLVFPPFVLHVRSSHIHSSGFSPPHGSPRICPTIPHPTPHDNITHICLLNST